MPIHNEEAMLPISLPSILNLDPPPSEVVCVFDRCTDDSLKVAEGILGGLLRPVFIEELSDWVFHVAYVRRTGFRKAKENVILNTDADVLLDPSIRRYFPVIGRDNVAMISFERVDYPPNWRHCLARILQPAFPGGFHGQYFLHKPAWLEAEDQGELKKMRGSEDSFLYRNLVRKGYQYRFADDIRNVHLRQHEDMETWMRRGMARRQLRYPLWKVVADSVIFGRPGLLVGWLVQK